MGGGGWGGVDLARAKAPLKVGPENTIPGAGLQALPEQGAGHDVEPRIMRKEKLEKLDVDPKGRIP